MVEMFAFIFDSDPSRLHPVTISFLYDIPLGVLCLEYQLLNLNPSRWRSSQRVGTMKDRFCF